MGATKKTPFMGLPQFIDTDKPSWLTDVNDAMMTIDQCASGVKETINSVNNSLLSIDVRTQVMPSVQPTGLPAFWSTDAFCLTVGNALIIPTWVYALNVTTNKNDYLTCYFPGNLIGGDGTRVQDIGVYAMNVQGNGTKSTRVINFKLMYNEGEDRTELYCNMNRSSSLTSSIYFNGTLLFEREAKISDGCN